MSKSSARVITSAISTYARQQARRQREAETAQRRYAREQIKQARERDRASALQAKQDRQDYLEARAQEVDDKNLELGEQIQALQEILAHTLPINDTIPFESLRSYETFPPLLLPQELTLTRPRPTPDQYKAGVKPQGLVEKALGLKGRFRREMDAAKTQYEAAVKAYIDTEKERRERIEKIQAEHNGRRLVFELQQEQRNKEVDELEAGYKSGDVSAVVTYNSMVLERSEYPEGFPQFFRVAYAPEPKELVIDYELPNLTVAPRVAEYKYVKTKDTIEEKPRKPVELKELYQDIVASVALRTIHEVLEADQGNCILVVTFSGYVSTIDPATGKDIHPYLISVRVTRDSFMEINLARVDKRACLRNLGAQVSPQPQEMQPVKPVVEFDMVDKRFVEQRDVISDLESRPNLMDLTPHEFENLISNLFQKMGLETKLTRSSRDGGVDVVAYDVRPVLGGRVVIQAKRYRHTVGVSAIRDLYGTMMNEGANKGIIAATSSYGPDAYEFAKDKPIELIDGGSLLYLLEQVGVKARIVMPDDQKL
jgi:restriction system protein